MNRKIRYTDIVFLDLFLTALLLMTIGAMFFVWSPYRLEFKEQIGIFFLGAGRMAWYLSNPALLASIAGDWLTQFYNNAWMASVLSLMILVALLAGLALFHRIARPMRPFSLILLMIPVAIEGFFIPYPFYPVSSTVGLLVSVWAAYALAHISGRRLLPVVYCMSVPVMFVLVGGHAVTMALMLAFLKRKDGIAPLLGLVTGVILMMVCGRLYNLTLLQTFIWPVASNSIIPPVWLILAQRLTIPVVLMLSCRLRPEYPFRTILFRTLVFGSCIILVRNGNDKELESTIKIGSLAYQDNWKEVKRMAASHESDMYGPFYWNLCNAREGRLADELLSGRWGKASDVLFLSTGSGDSYFSIVYYIDALLEMGDVSQATDCALLFQTVMPGCYSSRILRRLAQISVVAGDYEVASKYLDILSRTRNHREWACELLECLDSGNIPDQYLRWRSRASSHDRFFGQGDTRGALEIIASDNPSNKTAIDYLLCSYLLDKNVNNFVNQYDRFYLNSLDRVGPVPEIYQEALLVNVNSKESLMETVGKYRISQNTVDRYMSIMEARAASDDPNVMPRNLTGTYWNYIMSVKFNKGNR